MAELKKYNHIDDFPFMNERQRELWASLAEAAAERDSELEQAISSDRSNAGAAGSGTKFVKTLPFWPELPRGRSEIDHVHDLLIEWADLATVTVNGDDRYLFRNSAIHSLECALLLWLAPYASNKCFDSEIFADMYEFDHHCNPHIFQPGYPLEMAEALRTIYALEKPWELQPSDARKLVTQLIAQIKDIALYFAEETEFWAGRFKGGRQKGTYSNHKKAIEALCKSNQTLSNKELWKTLKKVLATDRENYPLYLDQASGEIIVAKTNKVYSFSLFQKHLAEIRNKK